MTELHLIDSFLHAVGRFRYRRSGCNQDID